MNVGGTEKALLNMIAEIPKDEYDITLLLLEEYGGFFDQIPREVHVKYLQGFESIKELINKSPYTNALNFYRKRKYIKAFNILSLHLISKITNNRTHLFKYILKKYPMFKDEYDIAVAYAGPMEFISYYVVNKIKATRRIQWIHFDVTKIGFNRKFAARIYSKFDKVFVVSNEGKNKLINLLPNVEKKVEVFFNLVSFNQIIKMAEDGIGFEDDFKGIRILTVGRLSKEKGQDLTIPVLAKLKQEGYIVRWYCIGDGNARGDYEKLINEYDIKSDYVLLGTNPNPYPFIKQCDIYVQPSRYEGYCMTILEAQCLCKPVIATNVNGVKEQIRNKENGLIVDIDVNRIYEGVKILLDSNELRERFTFELNKQNTDNKVEISKLNL
jgi:glycosyltransferase involved in cell wall biosynthesis